MPFTPDDLPFTPFTRAEWSRLGMNTPLTLSEQDIAALAEQGNPLSMEEVKDVYIPLCRLISMWVVARAHLHDAANEFMNIDPSTNRVPWIIGVAGSVGAGKSTIARLLQALLITRGHRVDLVSTDGFIYPNAELERRGLTERKGFPESYDQLGLLRFLQQLKDGQQTVESPVYSHSLYDIVPGETTTLSDPEIVLIEGLNVLQPARLTPGSDVSGIAVSDYIDFSVYVDAPLSALHGWFMGRFGNNIDQAVDDPESFYYPFTLQPRQEALAVAQDVWDRINVVNYHENIQPTRNRASCILIKDKQHKITNVLLRKF